MGGGGAYPWSCKLSFELLLLLLSIIRSNSQYTQPNLQLMLADANVSIGGRAAIVSTKNATVARKLQKILVYALSIPIFFCLFVTLAFSIADGVGLATSTSRYLNDFCAAAMFLFSRM